MDPREMIEALNAETAEERLSALRELKKLHDGGVLPAPPEGKYVNNHIHTTYSFSPYSPTKAIYMAWINGLATAGIMDHDSVAGAEEFIEAGKIVGVATTVALECRLSFADTPFCDRHLNNPDQKGIAYIGLQGIPHQSIEKVQAHMQYYREKRNERNRKMVKKLNEILKETGIELDFERDVLPLSQAKNGGGVTERHLLYALCKQVIAKAGKGESLVKFVTDVLGIVPSAKNQALLLDENNPFCEYDLLGVLKSSLVERFYVEATEECMSIDEFIALAEETGAVPAYSYLGDVTDSVTGDKKAQIFEDEFLEELIAEVTGRGFTAVTYSPTRNTYEQIDRLRELCREYNLFEISGEDINSPRQSFKNDIVLTEKYARLVTATWALIGHELAGTECLEDHMFAKKAKQKYPEIWKRAEYYSKLGMESARK